MEIACCLQLEDTQVCSYLEPLARHPDVDRVWIVRASKSRYAEVTKAEWVLTPGRTRVDRWARMARACNTIAARPEVAAFVSFNPHPYGMIGAAAARRHGKAVHLGYIGTDWYRDGRGPLGPLLLPLARSANFVTATGARMRDEMIARGLRPERVAVLPHAIDLGRHPIAAPEAADHAFVYVGKLVRRKRVDTILDALARVRRTHRDARLLIVGDGPERGALEAQTARLGLERAVTFVGFQQDPAPWFARARVILIASVEEGFPFTLVEGLARGLVPVSARVGTVEDVLHHELDSLLFDPGDVETLTQHLKRLLSDPALHARLRAGALRLRPDYDFSAGTAVWDRFLRTLPQGRGRA